MLAKCANPECGTRFRYLNEGVIYLAEWPDEGDVCDLNDWDRPLNRAMRRQEMFWLCNSCNRRLTLMMDDGGIVAVPRVQLAETDARRLQPLNIRSAASG